MYTIANNTYKLTDQNRIFKSKKLIFSKVTRKLIGKYRHYICSLERPIFLSKSLKLFRFSADFSSLGRPLKICSPTNGLETFGPKSC